MINDRVYYEKLMDNVQQDIVDYKYFCSRFDALINRLQNDYNELEFFLSNFCFQEEEE